MNNINLSTNDVSHIVKYIKNKLNQSGGDCTITPDDFNNIPNEQHAAIEKLKMKFGNEYINKINEIKNDYIDLKGGKFGSKGFSRSPRPSRPPPLPPRPRSVSLKSTSLSLSPKSPSPARQNIAQGLKKTQSWGKHLGYGILGQTHPSGKQTFLNTLGQSVGSLTRPFIQQATETAGQQLVSGISNIGTAGTQRLVSKIQGQPQYQQPQVQYQQPQVQYQQPQVQQQTQPIEITAEQVQEQAQLLQQEQQKTDQMEQQILQLQALVKQLQQQISHQGGGDCGSNESDIAELLKMASNICHKVNMRGGNAEAGEVSSSIFLPVNLQHDTEPETEQKVNIPKMLVANSLYTIDS